MIIDKENSFILKTPDELNKVSIEKYGFNKLLPYPEGGDHTLISKIRFVLNGDKFEEGCIMSKQEYEFLGKDFARQVVISKISQEVGNFVKNEIKYQMENIQPPSAAFLL